MKLKKPGKPVLTGTRIVLRPITADDADCVFGGMDDAEANRLTGSHGEFPYDRVAAHCARVAKADDRWDYAITVDGRMVGEVVLNEVDEDNSSANIRIVIWDPEARSKGYGTEAMELLTRFGIEEVGLHRIELGVFAFNPRAIRSYEKVGYVHEGTRRHALLWDGEWIDQHTMGMLASDWAARTA
ncbi:GNAT family N-acetyltransferase [Croceicoccus naphthovorans]|uniref:Uncharacterized protein n=1 Tax=Croceicoccus naphthovorans TaxID=1348774 RepID=A0A0G3XGF9_9SPHN|nr:GNAT family protein [Croceicoccus naphthovorans]AKM10590.1 hypothetical protein AB433_12470 [Croceicoccus naphthovorans]MBB3988808.1 RimJ/RimL family protein N-acetyltransferase [Croceicoccus naphthovorans]